MLTYKGGDAEDNTELCDARLLRARASASRAGVPSLAAAAQCLKVRTAKSKHHQQLLFSIFKQLAPAV